MDLATWMNQHDQTPHTLGRAWNIQGITLKKLAEKRSKPTLETVLKIHELTGGLVTVTDWADNLRQPVVIPSEHTTRHNAAVVSQPAAYQAPTIPTLPRRRPPPPRPAATPVPVVAPLAAAPVTPAPANGRRRKAGAANG